MNNEFARIIAPTFVKESIDKLVKFSTAAVDAPNVINVLGTESNLREFGKALADVELGYSTRVSKSGKSSITQDPLYERGAVQVIEKDNGMLFIYRVPRNPKTGRLVAYKPEHAAEYIFVQKTFNYFFQLRKGQIEAGVNGKDVWIAQFYQHHSAQGRAFNFITDALESYKPLSRLIVEGYRNRMESRQKEAANE